MKKITFAFTCLLLSIVAHTQNADLSATLDTNRILIGEQTTLNISAKNISTAEIVLWPTWPDTLKSVEIISQNFDTLRENGTEQITQKLLLTSFDSGYVVIPPFVLITENDSLKTDPLILMVGTVELDPDQELYDIKGPVKAPIDWIYWLKKLWFIALILALVTAVLLWLWLRKRKEKMAEQAPPDLRTPAERARDNLAEIEAKNLWQNGHLKLYYSEVSDALRQYIEEQNNIPALEMISDELLEATNSIFASSSHQILGNILRTADAVKFAKAKPSESVHTQLLQNAKDFINATEIKPDSDDE